MARFGKFLLVVAIPLVIVGYLAWLAHREYAIVRAVVPTAAGFTLFKKVVEATWDQLLYNIRHLQLKDTGEWTAATPPAWTKP